GPVRGANPAPPSAVACRPVVWSTGSLAWASGPSRLLLLTDSPPTVRITAPPSGSTFRKGSDITIRATASDSDGAVGKVEFYAGQTKLGHSTTAPYSLVW